MESAIFHLLGLLLISWSAGLSSGFLVRRSIFQPVNGENPFRFDVSTLTHQDITREAILEVARELLIANPNPDDSESTARISALPIITIRNLITAYYGGTIADSVAFQQSFLGAINAINDANFNVDVGTESDDAAAHFYSERLQSAQNRLVTLRQNIVTQILAENFELARTETGRMLHTLQDFYSNSNWIENGNRRPNNMLGRLGDQNRPGPIASVDERTCFDCQVLGILAIGNPGSEIFRTQYTCPNNIRVQNPLLTTGYHSSARDAEGVISKPSGKCSIGGFGDLSADTTGIGGINKDSTREEWSPHFNMHADAAQVAQFATSELLLDIRGQVRNDELFLPFLGLTVQQTISIAYVIDVTGSMFDELPEIQATIPEIRTSLAEFASRFGGGTIVRYILVPFNDPDPGIIMITEDVEEFLAGIGALVASGGGDIPEPSIGALIRAAEASELGSPIFVYTDAVESDGERIHEAIALLVARNLRVTFALVDNSAKRSADVFEQQLSRGKRQVDDTIYAQIAAATGGQILNLRTTEFSELGTLITFAAIPTSRTILLRSGFFFGTLSLNFPVDSATVQIMISINGDINSAVSVLTPSNMDATTLPQFSSSLISSSSFIGEVNITDDSLRGEWSMTIPLGGTYSVQVSADSELTFITNLFRVDSSSTYGFSAIEGVASEGEPLIVSAVVEGTEVNATVTGINLLSNNGDLVGVAANVSEADENTYVGIIGEVPSDTFIVELLGVDGNGFSFAHISDSAVEVTSINLAFGDGFTGSITLRPGETATVILTLTNNGPDALFSLTATTVISSSGTSDFFDFELSPTNVVLGANSSTEVTVQITLADTIADGSVVTFTVIAVTGDTDDFIRFSMAGTTIPAPQFTENSVFITPLPCTCERVAELGLKAQACQLTV